MPQVSKQKVVHAMVPLMLPAPNRLSLSCSRANRKKKQSEVHTLDQRNTQRR